jgi:death-on-curing protein
MDAAYLTVADIVALHDFIMQKTGFVPAPLHDEGGLESAAMRPQALAYYEGADLVRQAAVLAVGISQARAFLDGNKRTALIAMDVFLQRNGVRFTGDDLDVAAQLERIAEAIDDREGATDRFEAWLRANSQPG